jgi:phytoene dehydrogenase-like protein
MKTETLIIGAGLAGLTCARALREVGHDFLLVEAEGEPGGRVRTQNKAGFLLDRGFQIFLEAYPEPQRWLDYDALHLKAFYPGAQIMRAQGPVLLGDPLRKPQDLLATAFAQVGSPLDKVKVLALRTYTQTRSLEKLWQGREMSTLRCLEQWGFSEAFIQQFFKPFLGGVFLDPALSTSSHLFYFVMKMFAEGRAVIPAKGMQQIPEQLARWIPAEQILYRSRVTALLSQGDGRTQWHKLRLEREESTLDCEARQVVVATDAFQARQLLGARVQPRQFHSSRTLYFASDESPVERPVLVLNGEGKGPVNNLVNLSLVSAAYAPPGQHLLSLSILGEAAQWPQDMLIDAVREQMYRWFGSPCEWHLLEDMVLPHSLPVQNPPLLSHPSRTPHQAAAGIVVGGDHTETGSIEGAMKAGRLMAEAVLQSAGVSV